VGLNEVKSDRAPARADGTAHANIFIPFLLLSSMPKALRIAQETDDAAVNIALDTIKLNKQAIFFCNSKRGAESLAEKLSLKIKDSSDAYEKMSETALHALPKPTKQCNRLALCLKKGIAFHHAGLAAKQRSLIEDNFRNSTIKVICATPTLAFGLDLPAFRVVIRDVKRFGRRGMDFIPVLEYEQMCGRAGRPGKEEYGEAIMIAGTDGEKEKLVKRYVEGEPEQIFSKLAVEPVLRTYVLSLIASDVVPDRKSLISFFEKTFYAHHFRDMTLLSQIIDKILGLLEEWEFITVEETKKEDFSSAFLLAKKKEGNLEATPLGKRVSELYLDPLSAHNLIMGLRRATAKSQHVGPFSFVFLISRCNEIAPHLRVRTAEYEELLEVMAGHESYFLEDEPSNYGDEFEEFLYAFKTSLFFEEWIAERDEEFLLEKYSIRPGEVHAKLDLADWLLYCTSELSRMLRFMQLQNEIAKLRIRIRYGVKEELLPLLRLKGVGRVRARTLYANGMKTLQDVRTVEQPRLANILGKKLAEDVKTQLGEEKEEEQVSLEEWKLDREGRE
jgi:helicase